MFSLGKTMIETMKSKVSFTRYHFLVFRISTCHPATIHTNTSKTLNSDQEIATDSRMISPGHFGVMRFSEISFEEEVNSVSQ